MRVEFWCVTETPCEKNMGMIWRLVQLAQEAAAQVCVISLGRDRGTLSDCGAEEVWELEPHITEEACAKTLVRLCRKKMPDVLVFPSSDYFRTTAALVAAELKCGLAADCTGLDWRDGRLVQIRPAYGSSLLAEIIHPNTRPQMATVNRGAFFGCSAKKISGQKTNFLQLHRYNVESGKRIINRKVRSARLLEDAEVIVAGGMGIGTPEGFALLHRFAEQIGASLAGSRAAVSAGWIPYSCQVGLTGVTVKPKIYLAFGISGAVQHLVGMEGTKTVVAVNTDPKAPIFSYADIGIVGDWEETINGLKQYFLN